MIGDNQRYSILGMRQMGVIESGLFIGKKLLSTVLLPPLLPLLLVLVGLVLWRRRAGRVLALIGLVLGWLLATPAVVMALAAPLQATPPITLAAAKEAQAIVILGGGRYLNAPEYGGATTGRMALERLRYGARLARQTGLPVLVSGGAPNGQGPAEAVVMRDELKEDFNVPVRWVEDRSLDTKDNAQLSAAMLATDGVRRVVLVTHAIHMPRAIGEFTRAGLDVVPAPMGYFEEEDFAYRRWLPNANGAFWGWFACHEWLGLGAQRLRSVGG
ncbi:MAG: hypothetical protein RIR70_678 [Pseudomonadota bacterium]|jgi:uncharacterized SAM-binding protein YcdF (DUF218 family)